MDKALNSIQMLTDDLLTGLDYIDYQLWGLLKKVNMLVNAAKEGKAPDKVCEVMPFLEQYVTEHFTNEERLHEACNYPDMELHKEAHAKFRSDFSVVKAKYNNFIPDQSMVAELVTLITAWIADHIHNADKAFATFLKDSWDRGKI